MGEKIGKGVGQKVNEGGAPSYAGNDEMGISHSYSAS